MQDSSHNLRCFEKTVQRTIQLQRTTSLHAWQSSDFLGLGRRKETKGSKRDQHYSSDRKYKKAPQDTRCLQLWHRRSVPWYLHPLPAQSNTWTYNKLPKKSTVGNKEETQKQETFSIQPVERTFVPLVYGRPPGSIHCSLVETLMHCPYSPLPRRTPV